MRKPNKRAKNTQKGATQAQRRLGQGITARSQTKRSQPLYAICPKKETYTVIKALSSPFIVVMLLGGVIAVIYKSLT